MEFLSGVYLVSLWATVGNDGAAASNSGQFLIRWYKLIKQKEWVSYVIKHTGAEGPVGASGSASKGVAS